MNLTQVAISIAAATSILTACGGAGASIDKVDRATLVDGATETRTLKFWMKERGMKGDAIVPNVHFDDGANQRIVLWYEPALAAKVDALVQGHAYKVSFKYTPGDELTFGTLIAVE